MSKPKPSVEEILNATPEEKPAVAAVQDKEIVKETVNEVRGIPGQDSKRYEVQCEGVKSRCKDTGKMLDVITVEAVSESEAVEAFMKYNGIISTGYPVEVRKI